MTIDVKQAEVPLTAAERWDLYDDRLAIVEAEATATSVALLEQHTGTVRATFESIEHALAELGGLSDSLTRNAFLAWLPMQASTRHGQHTGHRALARFERPTPEAA